MTEIVTLTIEALGHRGDGVAPGPVFVPFSLPGETIEAEVEGERGRLLRVIEPSGSRAEPFCSHFTVCGGCVTQHLAPQAYLDWKRGLVGVALRLGRIEATVAPVINAHGHGRRRATFHARGGKLGFAMARSHDLVDLDTCPLLTPALNESLPACHALATALSGANKPIDMLVTSTRTGLDIDFRGTGKLSDALRLKLADLAGRFDLARLSNHGDVILERRAPLVRFGNVDVSPPPGSFLQATEAADEALAGLVREAIGGAKKVLDLFSGCGTLGLALADRASIHAIDGDKAAIGALDRAARRATGLKPVTSAVRDLFYTPLTPAELKPYDAVIFDPPRAGAEAQAKRLAASSVRRVVAVSCSPTTFARDAGLLIAGGFKLGTVTPVDQFRHAAHVELVALFTR